MKLAVLNPGGNDPFQAFNDFAGPVNDRIHAPVNYHAYAACTGGGFYCKTSTIPEDQKQVLVLLRHDLKAALTAVRDLKAMGKTVAISWKESGLHQIALQLADPKNFLLFKQICGLADGALSSTPDLLPIYTGSGAQIAEFLPTPYPVDDPRWDFSIPIEERSGVLIGTREFDVPSRNHLAAILSAVQLNQPITVLNQDGRAGRKRVEAIGGVRILEGRLAYSEYLRMMARHRLVFQLDRSAVPGQVAGDALLCRVPCVGGDSAVERVAFPALCGGGVRDMRLLLQIARDLLASPECLAQAIEDSQKAAREAASFGTVAVGLAAFFKTLATNRSVQSDR
jgi:hypothetical protein